MLNIHFNNTSYNISEAALNAASERIKAHLSTVMNGSGASVNLGGTAYSVDSTELSTATSDFISHLGTVAGSGYKVMVGGVEYGVDSAKMSGAMAEIEAVLAGLNNPDAPAPTDETLEGDGQEFYKFAPSTLSFRSTAPLNELQEVQINGVTVDPSNYELEEGSTIVKLKYDYLSTLDVGNYELSVVSNSKTVNGGFTVMTPELNEYGFYYNVPYSYLADIGDFIFFEAAVIFRDDGTTYAVELGCFDAVKDILLLADNQYSFKVADPDSWENDITLTGTFSPDGKSFIGTEVYVVPQGIQPPYTEKGFDCVIDPTVFASDKEYVYVIDDDRNYYTALPGSTKAFYESCKSTVADKPVSAIAYKAFYDRADLERIEISSSITNIGWGAFEGCTGLSTIIFNGTISQWNAVYKGGCGEGEPWNRDIPATYVQCSDGQVALV